MTVWFTSDPHWGHAKVAELRGFPDPLDHDLTLVEHFVSVVKPEDQVWWLGDLAMGNPQHALAWTSQIPGTHHLIWGNHDRGSSIHREAHKWQRPYLEVFETAQAFAKRRINGLEVLLSHYPYADGTLNADHTEEVRLIQYRLPDLGLWLLHGHTHNADQRLHGHQIHVGLDAWGLMPVSLDTIQKMISDTLRQEQV